VHPGSGDCRRALNLMEIPMHYLPAPTRSRKLSNGAKLWMGAAAAALLFASNPAGAAAFGHMPSKSKSLTVGPFSDIKADWPIQPQENIANGWETLVGGNVWDWDTMTAYCFVCQLANESARFMQGVAYETSPKGNFTRSDMIVTTIYGEDLNPQGTDLAVTGYTSANPEVAILTEAMLGKSGKKYESNPGQVVRIGDLAKVLGPNFDLSPFQYGDPDSVVYVFQTTMPVKDAGAPTNGTILSENFSGALHTGADDPEGAFLPGNLQGTGLQVVSGNVDVLGVLNGTKGACVAVPAGNCLDLIGDSGAGAVTSLGGYNLDPAYTYTIQFTADTGDLGGGTPLNFNVSLGDYRQSVTATSTPRQFDLTYTPTSPEARAFLGFASDTNVDDMHGPVLSNITLCAHKVGTRNLRCKSPN
jgi:hypothetical protein